MPLLICGVSIGNPEDIAPRVIKNLAQADLIAAEDTRSAALLLQRHGLRKELLSLYDHNETVRVPQLLDLLQQGQTIALLAEAGMPLISDPGYHLVKAARNAGLPVEVIPGPTALITALAASGLQTDRIAIEGFLPAGAAQRQAALQALAAEKRTLIFYEAPHRIIAALRDIDRLLPERICFVARELTKKHQECWRGPALQILAQIQSPRGEFVLVLSGNPQKQPELTPELSRLAEALRQAGLPAAQTAGILAEVFALPKNKIKKMLFP